MESEFRTAARTDKILERPRIVLTGTVFAPAAEQDLADLSAVLSDIAEIAYHAADGHIPNALRLTREEWLSARDHLVPDYDMTTDYLCQISGRNWRKTLALGFTPVLMRRLGLLNTSPLGTTIARAALKAGQGDAHASR